MSAPASRGDYFVARNLAYDLGRDGCEAVDPEGLGVGDADLIRDHESLARFRRAQSDWAEATHDLYEAFERHKRTALALRVATDDARFEAFKVRHLRGLYDTERAKTNAAQSAAVAASHQERCERQDAAMRTDLEAAQKAIANAIAVGDAG